jgi:hypothetical protein
MHSGRQGMVEVCADTSMFVPSRDKLWREEWLTQLSQMVLPVFKSWNMAPFRVTCGWPCKGGIARRRKVVGECHALESSKGGVHEIFISPALDQPLEVAGTVCHEMAHVAAGIKAGHGSGYRKVCKSVDLTKGSPTNASPGPVLTDRLQRIVESLGDYPHMALVPVVKPVRRPKTAVTLACLNCGCRVRISIKWLDQVGSPMCGCGGSMGLVGEDS